MQNYVFKDISGHEIAAADLPEGFSVRGKLQTEQYPNKRILKFYINALKDTCSINAQSGDSYIIIHEGPGFMGQIPRTGGAQNESGVYYASYIEDIASDLDRIASKLSGMAVQKADSYLNLPGKLSARAQEEQRKAVQDVVQEMQMGAQTSPIPVGFQFRNYLLDGGTGVYRYGDNRILAVSEYRIGMEVAYVNQYGIFENLSGEPFGQATNYIGMSNSEAVWSVPFICFMFTDKEEDLAVYGRFIDSLTLSATVLDYAEQLRQEDMQMNYQKAQAFTMQNQAMLNNMWAQQQAGWAASDRLRDSIHRDLDQFHNSIHQRATEMDQRFFQTSAGMESVDDRIQRMRHESIMGVETYEREDGSEYEYSNMADRVFENNLDQTSHFGTKNYFDDYIPEGWHELKKKQ